MPGTASRQRAKQRHALDALFAQQRERAELYAHEMRMWARRTKRIDEPPDITKYYIGRRVAKLLNERRKTMILSPAYGRDYRSAKAAKEDFLAGKDFIIDDIMDPYWGKPVSMRDLKPGQGIELRYAKKTKVTCFRVPERDA